MKSDNQLQIGCVILAAGNASRFGGNKLFAPIGDKMMIERAFDAIPTEKLNDIIVVTQYDKVAALAADRGFQTVINDCPELGISRSVQLGTEALKDRCGGILYQVADQPWLKRESVSKMLDLFRAHPESIVSMSCNGKRGNPCVFPEKYFDELCSLSGDTGGRAVIQRHEDDLILFEVESSELTDVDTPDNIM